LDRFGKTNQSTTGSREAFFRALVTDSLNEEIAEFHATFDIYLAKEDITTFFGLRPDGVVFNEKDKECVLLESHA
jgi:hypothetical protein